MQNDSDATARTQGREALSDGRRRRDNFGLPAKRLPFHPCEMVPPAKREGDLSASAAVDGSTSSCQRHLKDYFRYKFINDRPMVPQERGKMPARSLKRSTPTATQPAGKLERTIPTFHSDLRGELVRT